MPAPTTEKAARQVELILDAAQRSLARHGYAATSLARVAEEAGITKRMVLYYFDTREQLISDVVTRIGDQMAASAADAVAGLDEPAEAIAAGFQKVWEGMSADPALVTAYLGIVAEAVVDPRLRGTVDHVRQAFAEIVVAFLARTEGSGVRLSIDQASFTVLILSGFRGFLLEMIERGNSPELERALATFQQGLAAAFVVDDTVA